MKWNNRIESPGKKKMDWTKFPKFIDDIEVKSHNSDSIFQFSCSKGTSTKTEFRVFTDSLKIKVKNPIVLFF